MVRCDRGLQMLLTTAGAFAAFSLMAIAIGTDYWLYSSAHICNGTNLTMDDGPPPRRARGDLTHSGLWRVCCIEGPEQPPETQRHPELVQDSSSNAQIHNWAGTAGLSHKNTAWKLTAPRAIDASCDASQRVARA
ncbi:hypothetical protein ACRRTK_007822 [Alexandromys fortis]